MCAMFGELENLSAQVSKSRALTSSVSAIAQRLEALRAQQNALAQAYEKEIGDVRRLEGASFAKLWFSAIGKIDEKMEMEKREAMNAEVRLHVIEDEIETLLREKADQERELSALGDCARRYLALITEKEAFLRKSNSGMAQKLDAFCTAVARLDDVLEQIQAAQDAGAAVLHQIDLIGGSLNAAESYGALDLAGGRFVTHINKHINLSQAQEEMNQLRRLLDQFYAGLSDVETSQALTIEISGFLRFADWFFDGWIVDWAVLSRIQDTQNQLLRVEENTKGALARIAGLRQETLKRKEVILGQKEEFIVHA